MCIKYMKRRTLTKASVLTVVPLAGCATYSVPDELDLEVAVDAPEGVEYRHVDDGIARGLVSTSGTVEGEIIVQANNIRSIDFQSVFYDQESLVDSIERVINPESESFDQGHVEEMYLNLNPDSEPNRYEVTLNVESL